MNQDIAKYVLDLRRERRITRSQQLLLLVLACHHQNSRETWWPSRQALADEVDMDESNFRKVVRQLEAQGILRLVPGNGAGHGSSYVFVEIESRDVKGVNNGVNNGVNKGVKKGVFSVPLIRKDKSTNTQNLNGSFFQCERHPESRFTPGGTCWSCYAEQYPSECAGAPSPPIDTSTRKLPQRESA